MFASSVTIDFQTGELFVIEALVKDANGIAVSRAAGCGAGHVACDSLFWNGFDSRRD